MNLRDIIQIINLVLALIPLLPISYIVINLIKERTALEIIEDRVLNRGLVWTYGALGIIAVTNAIVALLSVLNVGKFAHLFSPFGRFLASTSLSIASWLIYTIYREIKEN